MKRVFAKRLFSVSACLATACASVPVLAADEIKVGLMLPFSGTYAQLGEAVEKGFKLHIDEQGGRLAGKTVTYVRVDDESEPSKASDNVNKLIKRDKVDVIVGTVHSGVVMAMAKAAKSSKTLLIIPHAGTDEVTGAMCAPNIFRSSFSNWQPAYGAGKLAVEKGYKRIVTVSWKYTAGEESLRGFKEGIKGSGSSVVSDLTVPFPNTEFQALLTQISALKPDAVYAFFGGAGAVKFVKDYAAAGLGRTIPLIGSGFLTEGVLQAEGAAAEGLQTTLHYADGLNSEVDKAFRAAYAKAYGAGPDVYAVQGYDAAQMLAHGLKATGGDLGKQAGIVKAIETMTVNSPRGAFKLSKAHSPVQDIYTRTVASGENRYTSIAAKGVGSPSDGCAMAAR
ncbi:ABC transporter substrate-binding protein [Pigmentiphaga sp. YJ18]|uniref:ABC transporter substrate-binding protein n=1 Tax=Pigmentiphaga sp. YJ18 TaxID=3134907 RepID=UPI003118FD63